MSILYWGPSIDASYQVSVHLAKQFQRRRFKKWPIRNKNCLWRPCLLTDRDEMSNLCRGPSIDAFYQVSVPLAKRFQRKRFLEIDQSETRIACGGHVCTSIGIKLTLFIENRQQMLPTKFQFIWLRGEDLKKSVQRYMHFEYRYLYLNRSYLSFNRRYFRNRPI